MSEPEEYDPVDGSTKIAYEAKHRVAAAMIINQFSRHLRGIDLVLVAVAVVDLLAMQCEDYAAAVDNAIALVAQIIGADGGPGEGKSPGRLALVVRTELQKLYAERVAESPRVS